MCRRLVGCTMALSLLCVVTSANAQTKLAWRFTVGQVLDVELTQRVDTDSQFSEKPLRVTAETTLVQQWTVDAVDDDGSARITQEFRRIAVKLELPQGAAVAYDSASTKKPTKEVAELAESLRPLVGGKLRIKLAPSGEICEVELDDALSSQLEKLPGDTGWKKLFSPDGMRQLLRQSLIVFPPEPLAAGATWPRQMDIDAPVGKIRQTSEFRYVGSEQRDGRTLQRIDVTSRVQLTRGSGPVEPPTIKEQSQSGQIWFDSAGGRLVESQSIQRLRTESKVRDMAVGVTLNSTLKTRVTLR